MANAYLSTLLTEMELTLESSKNLKIVLEEFLKEHPHVEGLSEDFDIKRVKDALITLDVIESQIESLSRYITRLAEEK